MREFLRIKTFQCDDKKFSIIYHCPHCVSITNLQVYRSGQVFTFVDRGSHYPVVNVTWEEDGSVQIQWPRHVWIYSSSSLGCNRCCCFDNLDA
ncbi:unnamed protein product [Arabidopsis lyrata]|nr:unnamed protein product [Arabidopsis lyrata]